VAYQQDLSAFGEEALQQLWGGDADPVPLTDVADVAASVASGEASRGVLPIENTILGAVQASHDAIDSTPGIHAIAETVVNAHLCLLGPPGATLEQVQDVFCHPTALAQCGKFFRKNRRISVHSVYDTAASAADVRNLADPQYAVVASRMAGRSYELAVVTADIEDRPDNQTRFIAFAAEPQSLPVGTPARTMILLTTRDVPGALLGALAPLARHGVNVRRIETRPTGEPWSYRFFVEFDHQIGDAEAEAVARDVRALSSEVRIFGTYPRWKAGRRGSIGWRSGAIPAAD
jgi:prephenate dehydratase